MPGVPDERVEHDALPRGRLDRSLGGFGPLDLKAGAFEVADEVAGGVEHGGISRSAVAVLEVAAVAADEQEQPARRDRAGRGEHDRLPFRGWDLEIEDEHELEGLWLGRVAEQVGGDPLRLHAARLASARAFARPISEKSTPVTRQPRSASQTALRPSPHARSSARPAGSAAASATRNRLGSLVHTSSRSA